MNSSPSNSPLWGRLGLPAGLHNAFLFSTFNALSFQIVLGSPMVLYAKGLGASATVLGVMTGMMPLLVIFQIPAAHYVQRVGYKRFVLAGWGTRVLFIFAMTLVPLGAGFVNAASRLALILALLFGFNLSRGISSCAWLPWITSLVPGPARGRYLSLDAAFTNVASFCAFVVGAACLGPQPRPWRFSVLFIFSGLMGAVSLLFLKKIPEAETPDEIRVSTMRVPWAEMLRFPPFRRLLRLVMVWSVAYGGLTAFTVAFLKVMVAMPEGKILLVTSTSFLGGLCSLWFLGSRLDSLGSKPVLIFSYSVWLVVLAGWAGLAGKVLPLSLAIVLGLQILMGLFAALVSMAHLRLAMAVIPAMGRNHFFAIYTVLGSLALGLSPIAWGVLIDAVGRHEGIWAGFEWNRYAVFFAATGCVTGIALVLATRLTEPQAASLEQLLKEVVSHSFQKLWVRFWPRG